MLNYLTPVYTTIFNGRQYSIYMCYAGYKSEQNHKITRENNIAFYPPNQYFC